MINVAENEICRLAPDSGQLEQIVHVIRHAAAEIAQDHLRRADDVASLGAVKAAGSDILFDLRNVSLGKALQRRKARKQRRRNLVYARVGALRGKPHGKQQLIILFIIKRTFGQGIGLLQSADYLQNLSFCAHTYHLAPILPQPCPRRYRICGADGFFGGTAHVQTPCRRNTPPQP